MAKPNKKLNSKIAITTKSNKRQKKLTKKQQKQFDKAKAKKLPELPSSFALTKNSVLFIKKHWRTLLGISAVYLLLNILLVRGISGGVNVADLKDSLDQAVGGNSSQFSSALNVFGDLLGGSSSGTAGQASALQSFLLVYESLVLIWVYRHFFSDKKVTVKQAYYQSTGQLVPFLLVVTVLLIQCLPLIITSTIYSLMVTSSLETSGVETLLSLVLVILGIAWTLRLLAGSVLSIYIVTLPDMLPMRALKSAKKLVNYRRLMVLRRMLFLPLIILLAMGLVVIPLIIYAAPLAGPVFYILATFALLFAHLYMYQLYRELIK